jgi:hypothetical protein
MLTKLGYLGMTATNQFVVLTVVTIKDTKIYRTVILGLFVTLYGPFSQRKEYGLR